MSTRGSVPQPPRFSEEIRKMECEPINSVEKKLIWYTFFSGIGLLIVLVLVSKLLIH